MKTFVFSSQELHTKTNDQIINEVAKQTQVKTIDIQAREWFDRVNGNSYFSALATINYGMPDEKQIKIPFQYGYGEHYVDMAADEIAKKGYIKRERHENGSAPALWRICRDAGIVLRTSKRENCLKRDVKAFAS